MEIGSRILPQPEKNQLKMLNIHDCQTALLFFLTALYISIKNTTFLHWTRVKEKESFLYDDISNFKQICRIQFCALPVYIPYTVCPKSYVHLYIATISQTIYECTLHASNLYLSTGIEDTVNKYSLVRSWFYN